MTAPAQVPPSQYAPQQQPPCQPYPQQQPYGGQPGYPPQQQQPVYYPQPPSGEYVRMFFSAAPSIGRRSQHKLRVTLDEWCVQPHVWPATVSERLL